MYFLHGKLCTLRYYIIKIIILLQCPDSVSRILSFHGIQMLVQQKLLTLTLAAVVCKALQIILESHHGAKFDKTCSGLLMKCQTRTDQRVFLAGWSKQDCNICFLPATGQGNLLLSWLLIFGLICSEELFFLSTYFFNLVWNIWSQLAALSRAGGISLYV